MKGTIRQRLTVTVVLISALTLTLLVFGFNLALRSSLDADADRLLDARAQAALDSVKVEDGRLTIGDAPDESAPDSLIWVFSGTGPVESPRVGPELDSLAASLAADGGGTAEDPATDTRLNAIPIMGNGHKAGMVVSGVSLEPYETTASRAAKASFALAGIMLILIGFTTRMAVDRALKPVAAMTTEAADWSEHDLDRRFNEGEPKDELTRLASTFDSMLDRMAHMLRHERKFSAEISHELRTPLAAIAAEAEIALKRERDTHEYQDALRRIVDKARELNRILETLLEVARTEGGSQMIEVCDVGAVLESLLASAADRAADYGVIVQPLQAGEVAYAQVAPNTLERIISPVLENALAFAGSQVSFELTEDDRMVKVRVLDDGPGIQAGEKETVFEPGVRGSASRNSSAPAATGLGLPLARRLARAAGGDVRAEPESGSGLLITVPTALDRDDI